jgi:hypothetical protein
MDADPALLLQFAKIEPLPNTDIFYKECPKHKYRIFEAVCLDMHCKNRTIVCSGCREESHRGHQIIYLRDFLESIKEKTSIS